jgi:hypothetical protein
MKSDVSAQRPSGWTGFFFSESDSSTLRLFERGLAIATFLRVGFLFLHSDEWLTVSGFHLAQSDRAPLMPHAMPEVPAMLVPMIGFALIAALLVILTREGARWAHALLAVLFIYFFHLDPVTSSAGDALCIIGWLVLATAPPTKMGNDGHLRASNAPLRILQISVTLFLVSRAVSLVFTDHWLQDWQTLWALVQGPERTSVTAWMLRNFPLWLWAGIQGIWILAQIAIPFGLWLTRFRMRYVVLALASNALMIILFPGHWHQAVIVSVYLLLFADRERIAWPRISIS